MATWRTQVPARLAVVATVLLKAGSLAAQGIEIRPAVQPEVHAGVIVSASSSAVTGVGVNVPAGLYVRLAASAAAGIGLGAGGGTVVRAEVVGRFLTDPFREGRWGPYAGGGIAASWRDGDRGRPALLVLVGTDLPRHGGWTPSLEFAVGAGARLQVAFRRARTQGR